MQSRNDDQNETAKLRGWAALTDKRRFPLLITLLLAAAAPAAAQDAAPSRSEREVTFSADQASVDPETGELVARGDVVMRHAGHTLEAARVRYNDETGMAIAEGGVTLSTANGSVLKASRMELNGPVRAGVIEHALFILEQGERVAAQRAQRFADGNSRLDRAVFSPCPACQEDASATPIWQLKAVEVRHDKEAQRLTYTDAFFEIYGIPVIWLPYFSHPDPTVERANGLLIPQLRTRDELGVVLELPYHWAISEQQDATFTPIITTKESPALAAAYRHHVGYGRYEVSGAFTVDDQPSQALTGEDNDGLRGHIFSRGRFMHGDDWQSTYQMRWASDDTFLRIYEFSDADTLISDYKLEGFLGRTSVRGELMGFKGLRIEDEPGLTGHALPWIDVDYVSQPGVLGGTLELGVDAVSLVRTSGADTRRATAEAAWHAPVRTPWGQRIAFDAFLRGDVFDVSEADAFDDPIFAGTSGTETRGIAGAAATITWPFASYARGIEQIIEPVVQLVASPEDVNDTDIPNEDSRAFELSSINLFALDRTAGFDLYESGSRVTYGLRYKLFAGDFGLRAMAGQSLRTERLDGFFPEGTGVTGKQSDVVGEIGLTHSELANLVYQFQLDEDDLSVRRHEVFTQISGGRFGLDLGYLKIDRGLTIDDRGDREEIHFAAELEAVENWTVFGGLIHRLGADSDPIEWESGVRLSNDCCIELGITVRKRFTRDRDVEPGTSVILSLSLRNLG